MDKHAEESKHKSARVEVYWTTVSYKTVWIYAILLVVVVLTAWWLLSPDTFQNVLRSISGGFGGRSEGVAVTTSSQARFVNLDGKVQIKKVDSVQWVNADFRTTLEKGDLVQTGPDGVARITFADGTTYTCKADTLITVEESSVGPNKSTRVGVHISSGAVDLSTGSWEVPGSTAEVSFENAVATLQQNTRAAVRSDPAGKQHEITVSTGGAEMARGDERIQLGQFERVSFPTGGRASKSQVMAPPELSQPVNLTPISSSDPKRHNLSFEWRPVTGAFSYHLRISTNSMFTKVVAEKKVRSTRAAVIGLDAGDYFWSVIASDAQNRASEPSVTYKFTLALQGKGQEMLLEVESTQLHGAVVEIVGRTEPGAALIINGQMVTNIQSDGRFRHFTPPLGRGPHTIRIIGQNRRGGYANKPVPVVIP